MSSDFSASAILVADDEPHICELLRDLLETAGATVITATTGAEALAIITSQEPDLAILDVRMPSPDGLEVLQQLQEKEADIPVIVITAQESSTVAIEAMRRGAYDYIAKPFNIDAVLLSVDRALAYGRLTRRVRSLEQQVEKSDPRDTLIGASPAMLEVYKLIGRVAKSDATVLITGESGTGKEVVAHVLHRTSGRREGPFVAVNCAALPETLLESELFGHEKGAFTGAIAQRKGRFEQAKGGTIFLDEIGEMSQATQKKLLRVLQERTFERLGGNLTVKADVRVLAATNRNLSLEMAEGRFREDLFYRLNVITIDLPPLRERKEDIPALVQHFLARASRRAKVKASPISEEGMALLMSYHWPGNVRQLENTIERAVVLSQGRPIELTHLFLPEDEALHGDLLSPALVERLDRGEGLEHLLRQVRAQLVRHALHRHHQNHTLAAALLRIPEDELNGEFHHV